MMKNAEDLSSQSDYCNIGSFFGSDTQVELSEL
jgi:hypothetical protein